MICNIILRLDNKRPEIIYTSNNFYETINEFEMIALDSIEKLGGIDNRKIVKNVGKKGGYYCVSEGNKLKIFKKERNGWFISGETKFIKEYELIYYRFKRNYNDEIEFYSNLKFKNHPTTPQISDLKIEIETFKFKQTPQIPAEKF